MASNMKNRASFYCFFFIVAVLVAMMAPISGSTVAKKKQENNSLKKVISTRTITDDPNLCAGTIKISAAERGISGPEEMILARPAYPRLRIGR